MPNPTRLRRAVAGGAIPLTELAADIGLALALAGGYYGPGEPGAPAPFRTLDDLLDAWAGLRGQWVAAGCPRPFGMADGETEPRAETLWKQHRGR